MKQVEFETRLNALKAEMNSELEAIEKDLLKEYDSHSNNQAIKIKQ